MNPTHWQRVQDLVEAASALVPEDRTGFLAREAGDDPALRAQVESMLAAWETSGLFEDVIGSAAVRAAAIELLEPGDRVGSWRILSLIGHGGMGSVFRAERADNQFRQRAAIKIVRVGMGSPDELLLRFRAERQILASITHPNIARLLDGGFTDSGLPYLVMEYVEGEPLDRYLARINPSLPARLALVQQICAAVQHAHQNLVVHRDLKPSNILITPEGVAKLLDFGIAKLLGDTVPEEAVQTRLTGRLMTPEYASPEQIRGEPITTATDIYSLGVVLYEVLTGTRPFRLNHLSPAEMERCIVETQPRPPSAVFARPGSSRIFRLPSTRTTDLDRIVLKSMHKLPARRYSSVSGLSADLQRFLDGFPVVARPDSFAYRSRLFIGRHRLAVTAATLFLLTVFVLTVSAIVLAARARREAASADSVSTFLTNLFQQARPDSTHGQSTSARDLLDQGAARLQSTPVKDPLVRARLLSTLGRVYFDLGDMAPATALLQQAETLYRQHSGETSLSFAQTVADLGTLEIDRSNSTAAQAHLQQALAIYRRLKGPESPEVAETLDSLGEVATTQSRFDDAESLLQESIRIHTRSLGPDAPPTLVDKHNLASVYSHLGDYQRELPLLVDVLAADRRLHGDLQEITTSDLGNLAWLEDRLGHFARAEALSYEDIALKSKLFGAGNPRLAMQLLVLGDVFRQTGRLVEARKTLRESLAMMHQFEGAASLHAAWDLDELGLVDLAEHHLPEARTNLLEALRIREGQSPPPLQEVSLSYDHLGELELAEANPVAAEQHLRHALSLEHTVFPHGNDSIAATETHLGEALATEHRTTEACALLEDAERIARISFAGEPHPILQASQTDLRSAGCLPGKL